MLHNNQPRFLSEGLEASDLARLIDTTVTVDEYRSKIGADDEIVVITFKIQGKNPALDLVSFIEKGYKWILDADASSGELDDGTYLVFVEADRQPDLVDNLMQLFDDLEPLTEIPMSDWTVIYNKPRKQTKLDPGALSAIIPLTPENYRRQHQNSQTELDQLKNAAGVRVETRAPKNDFTESLRIAAGIR